jgi:hypothetical protein
MTMTIAWNPLGFHLLNSLPKGRIFNAEYYRDTILSALLPLCPQADERKLMIHANNASLHTSRKYIAFCAENALPLAVHPQCSPGVARSDFFLFGHIKHCLR